MTSNVAISRPADGSSTSDMRWAAWIAKGAEHDRKVKQRVIVIGSALAAVLASWLTRVVIFR